MPLAASEIRNRFLSFFAQQGHTIVRSSPLVPVDPTLLFTNAGMVQFKDVFTGKQKMSFSRATSAQKCVRAGGKHNDLDNVGRTARHHTFFEMLGNFSFGDYFKKEAIALAWQFIHEELKLPKERLCFTVFRGEEGIPADDEARALWKKIAGVSEDRILGLGKKENFWMMGDTGPQGPCSEIHVFQGDDVPCEEVAQGRSCLGPACDCDRFLEIWNLVFMQFERRDSQGPLLPLPTPSIDTGAGLERLTAVVQGKRSNYDTDLFQPYIQQVSTWAGTPYQHRMTEADISMRVLADHCRTTAFLMADGVLPSNVGRGYVLRSIMRRAIRHAVRLKLPAGRFADLCLQVTQESMMGGAYPELISARSLIEKAVQSEEESFRQTIDRGLRLIAENTQWFSRDDVRVMPGLVAFQLHDTFGFPLDLTQVIGREQGFVVDEQGFAAAMEEQRARSKFAGSGDVRTAQVYQQIYEQNGPTVFCGYEQTQTSSEVVALLSPEGTLQSTILEGQRGEVILRETPFYGRGGGQVGDTGWMKGENLLVHVEDTWKPLPELIVHRVHVEQGTLHVGEKLHLHVEEDRREQIRKNHTATHLLHHVLQQVLGDHVVQKGSYVGPDKLTFDFSHFEAMSSDVCREVETRVNAWIQRNVLQETQETTLEQARALGAMALFGEKYGDQVRVLRFGDSVELCGGTHVRGTGEIGLFKIIAESSVAKGIRRLEAVTGPVAVEWVQQLEKMLGEATQRLRIEPRELPERIGKLLDEIKTKDREIATLKQRSLQQKSAGLQEDRQVGNARVVVRQVAESDPKILRDTAASLQKQIGADIVVVGGADASKVGLAVAVSSSWAQDPRYHAGQLVNQLAAIVGGKGGGRPELAQAGGTQPANLELALKKVFELLE